MNEQKKCLCIKCKIKDCQIKQLERLCIEKKNQVEIIDKNIIKAADGHIYAWDGPQGRFKMMY